MTAQLQLLQWLLLHLSLSAAHHCLAKTAETELTELSLSCLCQNVSLLLPA